MDRWDVEYERRSQDDFKVWDLRNGKIECAFTGIGKSRRSRLMRRKI